MPILAIKSSAIDFMVERRRRIRSFEWSTAIIVSISVAAGVAVYLRDGTDKVIAILTKDLELLVGMLPKMAAGCLIAAFVTRLLPREVVARVVGSESGLLGPAGRDDDGRGAAGRPAHDLSGRRQRSWCSAPTSAPRSPSSPPGTCSATTAR